MLKVKLILLSVLLVLGIGVQARHIAGGELWVTHLSGDKYIINLRFFRDCSPGAADFDQGVTVGIYDKLTNAEMDTFRLARGKNYKTNVGNNSCITSTSCIDVQEYSLEVQLPKSQYGNKAGYYFSWQRCCRNGVIQNIVDPGATGIAYYSEIPSPFPSGGSQFIDNHPIFNKPPVEFLCVGKNLSYNFNVTDSDGDSLVYSLVTPLQGNADTAQVISVSPGPYPEVTWEAGYDENNSVGGSPELTINPKTGTINVTPQDIGVFVISILVEEYRNGLKIGEVRRELELFVFDCRNSFSDPPVITSTVENTQIEFITGQTKCVEFNVSDPESDIVSLSFQSPDIDLAANGAKVTRSPVSGQTPLTGEFCWNPPCNIDDSKPITVQILATDNNGCPIKNYDTIQFQIVIKKQLGAAPVISLNSLPEDLKFTVGRQSCIEIGMLDKDSTDNLSTAIKTTPINIFSTGASYFQSRVAGKGENYSIGTLCWSPPCSIDPSQKINVQFITSDNSACPKAQFDTLQVQLSLVKTIDHRPDLTLRQPLDTPYVFTVGQNSCFELSAIDIDKDSLLLNSVSKGLDIFGEGAIMNNDGGREAFIPTVCWTPSCALDTNRIATVTTIATEQNLLCDVPLKDTLTYRVKLKKQANQQPIAESLFANPDEPVIFTAGVQKCIQMKVSDPDQDVLLWQDRVVSGINLYYEEVQITLDTLPDNTVMANLCWTPKCTIDTSLTTVFEFGAFEELNDCKKQLSVYRQIRIKVVKPLNNPPELNLVTPVSDLKWLLGLPHCLDVEATDIDNDSLHISLFTTNYDVIENGGVLTGYDGGDSVRPKLCWTPACNVFDTVVHALFIASDRGRACVKDMGDTLRFDIKLIKPTNIAPSIDLKSQPDALVFELGRPSCIDFEATDVNADSLEVTFYPLLFDIFKKGAYVRNSTGKDRIQPQLCWTPPCNTDTLQSIKVDVVVVDKGRPCMVHKTDTTRLSIKLKEPVNTPPVLTVSRSEPLVKAQLGKEICIDISAKDDNLVDRLVITPTFQPDIRQYGASIDPLSLSGYGNVNARLCWTPPCDWDTIKHVRMYFSVSDNACAHPYSDTTLVKLDIIPQPNSAPKFLTEQDSSINLVAGDELSFDVLANDVDGDSLIITTQSDLPVISNQIVRRGQEELLSLNWKTACEDIRSQPYYVSYKLNEVGCAKTDSSERKFSVRVVPNGLYKLPDIFTPNADGKNDVLKLYEEAPQRRYTPFYFSIYNRWGEQIFDTTTPYFEWDGNNTPDGVYIYHMHSESCPKEKIGFITIKR